MAGLVLERSGLDAKYGVPVVNVTELIDSAYRGEMKVVLINHDPWGAFEVQLSVRGARLLVAGIEAVGSVEVEGFGTSGSG